MHAHTLSLVLPSVVAPTPLLPKAPGNAKAGCAGFEGVEISVDARNLTTTMHMPKAIVIGSATATSPLDSPGVGTFVLSGIQARS